MSNSIVLMSRSIDSGTETLARYTSTVAAVEEVTERLSEYHTSKVGSFDLLTMIEHLKREGFCPSAIEVHVVFCSRPNYVEMGTDGLFPTSPWTGLRSVYS